MVDILFEKVATIRIHNIPNVCFVYTANDADNLYNVGSFLTASSFQNEWFTVWQSFQFPPRTKFVLVCNFITCKVFCLEDSFQMHFPSKLLTFSILTLNTLLFISILKLPCIWLYDRDMGKYVSLWIFEIFGILLLFPYRWIITLHKYYSRIYSSLPNRCSAKVRGHKI